MKTKYSAVLKSAIAIMMSVSLASCQEYDIDSQPEGPLNIQIDAMDSYTVMASSPSNVVFNVSSNTPWAIVSDSQWCTVTPAMSASSSLVSEVVVSFENNADLTDRTATLTIKADGIEKNRVITINQLSKAELYIIPADEAPASGGIVTFDIISNYPWKVIPSEQFVADIDKMQGEGRADGVKETVSINVPQNTGAARSATITVKTEYDEKTFTVAQGGFFIELANPEDASLSMPDAEEHEIAINSNVDYKATVAEADQSWLEAEVKDGKVIVRTKSMNNIFKTRTGMVTISPVTTVAGFEDLNIEVSQPVMFNIPAGSIVDPETGALTMTADSPTNVTTKYNTGIGHVTVEFDDCVIAENGTSWFKFNMWPDVGNTNYYIQIMPGANKSLFTCGGAGFEWEQKAWTEDAASLKAMRTMEMFIEEDPDNAGKYRIRMAINGEDKAILANKSDALASDPENNPGFPIYLQKSFTGDDHIVIKSITYEPAN